MSSKLCFLMTWICMRQIKLTFIQCNMIKVIWTFWRMNLGLLLQFCFCQGIAKFHIEIFIGQIHLTHNEAVSCAMSRNRFREILSNFHLVDNTRLKKIDIAKYKYYFKSWILISNSVVHLSITALMKALFLTMENMVQNNLLEGFH